MEEIKKPNYFARVLVIILSILIVVLIIYNFFYARPPGQINSDLVALIAILVLIALSESFDNFSVGQLLIVSREKRVKEEEINRVSNENMELRSQLIKVVTSINQQQTSTNILGFPEQWLKGYSVGKASKDEVREEEIQKQEKDVMTEPERAPVTRYDLGKIEDFAINKFVNDQNLGIHSLLREAKLIPRFQGIDPISDAQPIFDGYINTGQEEIFIDVVKNQPHLFTRYERYYFLLTKIYLYRVSKKVNAYLALLVVTLPDYKEDQRIIGRRPIQEHFSPAMANGILTVSEINVSKAEAKLLSEKKK